MTLFSFISPYLHAKVVRQGLLLRSITVPYEFKILITNQVEQMCVDAVKRGKTGKSKSYVVDFGFLIGRECNAVG